MQESLSEVSTPPRDAGLSVTDTSSLKQSPYQVDIDEEAGLVSSMVNHFESPPRDLHKQSESCPPSNVCVRPPTDADCSPEDFSEMGCSRLDDSFQSVPLPEAGLEDFDIASSLLSIPRYPRSFSKSRSDAETSDAGSRDAASLSESSFALGQVQEVRQLRRKLIDNLKVRQQQCLRTLTPLKQIEHVSCMPRSMTEMPWDSDTLEVSARLHYLTEELLAANLARDKALEEANQLRKEQGIIRMHPAKTPKSSFEARPWRRFSVLTIMMALMLAGRLPMNLRLLKNNSCSQGSKVPNGHIHQLHWR